MHRRLKVKRWKKCNEKIPMKIKYVANLLSNRTEDITRDKKSSVHNEKEQFTTKIQKF